METRPQGSPHVVLSEAAQSPTTPPQARGTGSVAAAGPLLPDIGVIALVPDYWGGPWMPRHYVLTRLARYFHVVWVDPPREWRDWWLRGARQTPVALTNETVVPGFAVYLVN